MAMTPKTPKTSSTKGSAFSQAVRALPKGGRGQAVSAMAKAKVKPQGSVAKTFDTSKLLPKMTPEDKKMLGILE
jgi:hypothetical protein